jgi:integrase
VGDFDFEAIRIWVRAFEEEEDGVRDDGAWDVKTASSQRTVDLPRMLQDDLRLLCQGKGPRDLVFISNRTGEANERKWLNRMVREICADAGVRVVHAHGLRDTYTSLLAALGNKSAPEIAELVGHSDRGRAAREHYIGAPDHRPALRLVPAGGAST